MAEFLPRACAIAAAYLSMAILCDVRLPSLLFNILCFMVAPPAQRPRMIGLPTGLPTPLPGSLLARPPGADRLCAQPLGRIMASVVRCAAHRRASLWDCVMWSRCLAQRPQPAQRSALRWLAAAVRRREEFLGPAFSRHPINDILACFNLAARAPNHRKVRAFTLQPWRSIRRTNHPWTSHWRSSGRRGRAARTDLLPSIVVTAAGTRLKQTHVLSAEGGAPRRLPV